ncbi:MAG: hypothetical protein AAF772_11930 [Acidobacteriota bacterium]
MPSPSSFLRRRPSAAAGLIALLLGLVVLSGCGGGDLEALRAELEACQAAKAEAETEAANWEARFDREAARWSRLEASVVEVVPNSLAEFDAERQRILELVPEQVQYEVGTYLDEYFGSVMAAFDVVRQDSEAVRLELRATQRALENVGQDTRAINASVQDALTDERARRAAIADRQDALAEGLGFAVNRLVAFERTRLCRGSRSDCPQKLRLNDTARGEIEQLHGALLTRLTALQEAAAHAPAVDNDPPAPTGAAAADDATDDAGSASR